MKDPDMAQAQEEISAILKKHNLMGAVLISNGNRSGFFHEVSPSWSCAKLEESGNGEIQVRIQSKRENYKSVEEQKEVLTKTVSGFMGLLHVHKYIGQNLTGLLVEISKKFDMRQVVFDQRIQEGGFKEE